MNTTIASYLNEVLPPNKDWLDASLLATQVLTLFFLIIYVVKTWQMASATRKSAEASEKMIQEMREARDQETAPYVVAYFDIQDPPWIYFIIKNLGRTVAKDVRLEFDPLLRNSRGDLINNLHLFKDGIKSLPPGYEIRTFFDSGIRYFNVHNLPLKYTVKITYRGGIKDEERVTEQVLDLQPFKGLSYIHKRDFNDLVKNIEKIVKNHSDIKRVLERIQRRLDREIQIGNVDFSSLNQITAAQWPDYILAKLREFVFIWGCFMVIKKKSWLTPSYQNYNLKLLILATRFY